MTLRDIAAEWLKEHGYDGLNDMMGGCSCGQPQLMFCGKPSLQWCLPAYRRNCADCPVQECDGREWKAGCWHPVKLEVK